MIPALILLLFLFAQSQSSTFDDYHARVHEAMEQAELGQQDFDYADEAVSQIRTGLPEQESVDTYGRIIAVDNSWLHALIDSYLSEGDDQKRREIINEVAGRLSALDDHLGALEEISGTGRDPREAAREILTRSAFREKKDDRLTAFIKEVKRKVSEFLINLIRGILTSVSVAGSGVSIFFRIAIIAVFVILVAVSVRMLMRVRLTKRRADKLTILGEEIKEEMTPGDLEQAAIAAAEAGDFRNGVRKLYISLLFSLSERGIIEIEPNLTNHEYLARVSKFQTLEETMRYLTERFDYFWYGMFPSTADDFSSFLAGYRETINRVQTLPS